MKNPIYSDVLTPMEKRIYKAIIFQGMDFKDLCKRYHIERTTVVAHINAICLKKQVWGNSRLFELSSQFWGDFLKMKNCTECKFDIDDKCQCTKAEDYEEPVNEYMICREFVEKKEEEKQ